MDAEGDEAFDTKDRPVWRIRKHDLEEFREIVVRHGAMERASALRNLPKR